MKETLNLEELMARPSKQEMKQLKFKCYLALIVSNLILFTLSFSSDKKVESKTISPAMDNIVLRLPLNLMLSLNIQQKTHVSLVDRTQRLHIANAWIWDEESNHDNHGTSENQQKFYSVEIHPLDAAYLLRNNLTENMLMAIPPITLSRVKKEKPYVEMHL